MLFLLDSIENTFQIELIFACIQSRDEVVYFLLEQRPELIHQQNKKNATALHLACMCGHLPLVKFLIEQGANVKALTQPGFTPLHIACLSGHLEIAQVLLEQDRPILEQPTKDGHTPLHVAALHGRLPLVNLLI